MKKLIFCLFLVLSWKSNASMIARDTGVTILMKACRDGKIPEVKRLLENEADVNAISRFYRRTALIYALKYASSPAPVVELLLKKSPNLEIKDINGNTALMHCLLRFGDRYIRGKQNKAIAASCRKSVWMLVKAGAKTNVCNRYGETPLTAASSWLGIDFIRILLEKGADVNSRDQYGYTSLIKALRRGRSIDIVKLLLGKGANPNDVDYNDMPTMFHAKNPQTARLLIKYGARPEEREITRLSSSMDSFTVQESLSLLERWSQWGDLDIIKLALKYKGRITDKVLVGASGNFKNPDVLPFLLKQRAVPSRELLNQMLLRAAETVNLSGMKLLIKVGADINVKAKNGRTPLITACIYTGNVAYIFPYNRKNGTNVIKFLIENGAKADCVDDRGMTPLLWLIKNSGDPGIIKLILAKGAKLNRKNKKGRTALLVLATLPFYNKINLMPIFEILLQHKADVNVKDSNGASALLLALGHQQQSEFIKRLLKAGAKVNTRSNYGVTPLMLAARHYKVDIVEKLILSGAGINAKDASGWTPLMYAAEDWPRGYGCVVVSMPRLRSREYPQKTIRLLIKHGAKFSNDIYGNTPLIEAAGWADARTLKLLIGHSRGIFSSSINAADYRGRTALTNAARHNPHDKAVEALIKAGADFDVNLRTGKFNVRNNLHIADGVVLKVKRYHNSATYYFSKPPLFSAIRKNKKDIVEMMLKHGADPNLKIYTDSDGHNYRVPMDVCNNAEIAKILEDAGAIINSRGRTSVNTPVTEINLMNFRKACQDKPVAVLKTMMIAMRLKTGERKRTAMEGLDSALYNNSLEVVKWLLSQGAKLRDDDILSAAGNDNYPEVLEYLLKQGLSAQYENRDGKTALYFASSAEIVNILIKNGADVNAVCNRDSYKRSTPLLEAVRRNWYRNNWRQAEVVAALIKHGAGINAKGQQNWNALQFLICKDSFYCDLRTVKVLLKNKIDLNSIDRDGKTVISRAALYNPKLFDMLFKAGAVPNKGELPIKTTNPYIKRRLDYMIKNKMYSKIPAKQGKRRKPVKSYPLI
jgi:ankyrin repeat protein